MNVLHPITLSRSRLEHSTDSRCPRSGQRFFWLAAAEARPWEDAQQRSEVAYEIESTTPQCNSSKVELRVGMVRASSTLRVGSAGAEILATRAMISGAYAGAKSVGAGGVGVGGGANGATAGAVGCGGGANGGGNGVLASEAESRLWQRRTKRAITCASSFSTSSEYS
jgi:hypothetical protein